MQVVILLDYRTIITYNYLHYFLLLLIDAINISYQFHLCGRFTYQELHNELSKIKSIKIQTYNSTARLSFRHMSSVCSYI